LSEVLYQRMAPRTVVRARSTTLDNVFLSFLGSTAIVALFASVEPRCRHWFLVPLLLCSTLIGADAVAWVRGQCGLFDPVGLLGLLGIHFFFLAPLLHVTWNVWMLYVLPPDDWREWLGAMACLNLIGLLGYRWSRTIGPVGAAGQTRREQYRLDRTTFVFILIAALLITGLLQVYVYHLYGGLSGYVKRYEDSFAHYGTTDPGIGFVGMGWLFSISESFPILAAIGFAALFQRRRWAGNPLVLALVFFCFFMMQLLFGGLRGSRWNILWGVFWLVGLIHLCMRRLSRRMIYMGLIGLLAFMYFYAFYKFVGLEGVQALGDSVVRAKLENKTGRTFQVMVLGDLGRSDVQAFALYRVVHSRDYDYAWGRTYLGALAIVIPRTVWPDRPPTKVKWTTEIESGKGSYSPGLRQSSRVYGLAGEAMLNFGPLSVPLVFIVFGAVVGWVRRLGRTLGRRDSRQLLLPLLILFCIVLLVNDSENNVFSLIKYGAVPALVVLLGSRKVRTRRLYPVPGRIAKVAAGGQGTSGKSRATSFASTGSGS